MIPGILLTLAGRLGFTGMLKNVAGVVIGIAGFLAIVAVGAVIAFQIIGAHDRHVISQDRAVSNAEVLNAQIGAERQAGADKQTRDDQFATNQTEMKEATDAAAQNGNSPLDSLFDKLR